MNNQLRIYLGKFAVALAYIYVGTSIVVLMDTETGLGLLEEYYGAAFVAAAAATLNMIYRWYRGKKQSQKIPEYAADPVKTISELLIFGPAVLVAIALLFIPVLFSFLIVTLLLVMTGRLSIPWPLIMALSVVSLLISMGLTGLAVLELGSTTDAMNAYANLISPFKNAAQIFLKLFILSIGVITGNALGRRLRPRFELTRDEPTTPT